MKSFALIVAALGPAALVSTLGRLSVDAAWVERLGWALIHTVWQFALIALAAAVLQWGLRRRSARARYAAGVVLLGAMAVAPAVTCCVVDVSRPSEVKHARIAPLRKPDETPSRDSLPFPRSSIDESVASEPPLSGVTHPNRHSPDPRPALGAHVAPHERPSLSWVAAFRNWLAPRLPPLVSLWLAGMALFALRPVWGLWMQWRLRRVGLSPVPASVAQSLDDLARRLGLRRTVGIAQSLRVGVPMAVGYLRPLILLPGCVLTGLTTAQLEALLAHELAHIRRHDWLVNAFQLLVETVFFYHPAVWWLSRQIRQERENCCDDLAVSLVGDRGTVGRMLLALEELRERTPGLALAATGGNLLSRVRRVVAKGRQPEPPGREWLPAAVVLLLAGLGSAAWAMSAGTADKKNSLSATPPPPTPAASAKAAGPNETKNDTRPAAKTAETRRVTGRVIDSQGQPVKAARLWWVVVDSSLNDGQYTIEGTSDTQGRFALEAPAAWKPRRSTRSLADMVWVLAPGKNLKAVHATGGTEAVFAHVDLKISLESATDFDYRVTDERGRPLAGAVVEPLHYRTPRGYEILPAGALELLRRTTDKSGRVRLTSLSREALYQVQIRTASCGTQLQRLDRPALSSPVRTIVMRAAGSIEGRLIADDPRWVRGVQLLFQTEQRPLAPWETEGEALVETDQQGRFRIPAIADGVGVILQVGLPAKSPLAPRLPEKFAVETGATVHLDIPMEKLVLVKGAVRTDDTHAPVAGAEIFVHYGQGRQGSGVTSDSQGHYEARVLAGPVYTQVISMPREMSAHYEQPGEPWREHIQVPLGLKEFELPAIVLSPTETRTGTLIDQRGRPIAKAQVSGIRGNRRYGYAETNERGEFSLQLPKSLRMDQYEVTTDGVIGVRKTPTIVKREPLTLQFDLPEAGGKGAEDKHERDSSATEQRKKTSERKPSTATTAPLAASTESKRPAAKPPDLRRVTGRVVDSDGKPVEAARLWWVVLDNSLKDEFTVAGTSDAQGRFALEAPAAWKPQRPARLGADTLWVFAPGKDLKVVRATDGLTVDGKDSPLVISLAPATETEYEIRDEQGHPIVRVVAEPRQFVARGVWWPFPTALFELLRRTTDESGRVRLTSLPREDFRTLDIRAPGFGTQQQRLDGPDEASPKRKITLRRTGTIEGRLIADDPQWVRGVTLLVRTEQRRPSSVWETEGEAVVETDKQGRFRIPAIATGAASIRVGTLPTKSPFSPRLPTDLWVTAGETEHVDIPMEKLVRVKGSVRTDGTQSPVVGAEILVQYGEWLQGDDVTSDSQGRYEAKVLPGRVRTQVISMPQEIAAHYAVVGEPWNQQVVVTPGLNEFELAPIVLSPTASRTGTLIDREGRPIAGARVHGIRGNRRYGFAETNERGEFSLQLPKKLPMDSYETWIGGRARGITTPTIVKYEPLTLQLGRTAPDGKPAKSRHEPAPTGTDKRQKTDDRQPTSSTGPSPLSTNQPSTTLAAATVAKASVGVPTLSGKISGRDGKPIAGATVMIWTAGVKHGYSVYCPSCYADCGKRAVTDDAGAFAIAHVDPELRFRLLVVRDGYAPTFINKVDPFGGPATVNLARRSSPDDPSRVVRARVVGPRGEPLAGAVVEAEMVMFRDENGRDTGRGGAVKGLDPLAVTNEQGEFEIAYAKPATSMTLMVHARGMAPKRFEQLETGTGRHTLALNHGASVRGRLVSHGRPVGHAEMGLVSGVRASDRFFSEIRIGTEPDGTFLFVNVPVTGRWYVYAKMDSILKLGATDAVECVTERDDEIVNVGDVTFQPGHRLSGRVVLSDGKPIPDGMRIAVGTARAWDDQIHDLPPDGRFEFVSLPTDTITISPAVKGYRLSQKNPNLAWVIEGLIDRDVDDFVILLDPGKDNYRGRNANSLRDKPLRSPPLP